METKRVSLWYRFVPVAALLCCAIWGSGQAPADGRIEQGLFKSSYFHFSYRYPSFLRPVDLSTMALPQYGLGNEFMMFAAQQGSSNYGVMFMAEKMGVGPEPLTGSLDFLKRVRPLWAPGDDEGARWGHIGSPSGMIFDTTQFRIPPSGFGGGAAAVAGDYILVFRFNAKSQDDLRAMFDSIRTVAKMQ